MTTLAIKKNEPDQMMANIESALIGGDLGKLSATDRIVFYRKMCETLDLNPLTKPFDYITLNGKLVLYANKGCTEQLRANKKVSITIPSREVIEGVYVVTANAKLPDGREDAATGAVPIDGLKGDVRANAMMKAETKAKRRVTLSICGLNMLDESEVETINIQRIAPEDPGEGNGNTGHDGIWRFTFGQWNRKTLEEIYNDPHPTKGGPKALEGYIIYLEDSAKKKGEPLSARAQDAIDQIADFLGAMENRQIEKMRSE